jgi:pyruvate/2-oxoglutarate dehydrogenase complex dihydrolipoamide acyltransferase (E2) component
MNKFVIPHDALIRFRNVASQVERGVSPRASRWLILKDDIAALRKRGFSYRAISDLLTQNGISASPSGIMKFCRVVLKEKRSHKPPAKRRPSRRASDSVPQKKPPVVPAKAAPSPAPASTGEGQEIIPFTTRGPRIAKVELLPPGETI